MARPRVVYQGDSSHLPDNLSTFRRQTWHKSDLATEPGLWYQVEEESPSGRAQIAMLEEQAVGRIAVTLEDGALRITDYHLNPDARGHRYGAQLMGQAVQYARAHGREQVVLACGSDLAGYFAQFGFVPRENGDLALDIRLIMREIPE